MSQASQERILEEHVSRNFDYGKEFRLKVSVDYRAYVFLSPKQEIDLSYLVIYAKNFYGFEAYRLVHKEGHIIHLYMKFQSAEMAMAAIETLQTEWEAWLHVASVSDMLEAMYAIENSNRVHPLWTTTIVDTVGEVRMTNPLNRQVISSMLLRFGDPRIYDLQWEGARVKSVQALFSSLAEAMGAAIAFGHWIDDRNPYQNFHYRIRIVGGEKELQIFFQLKIPNYKCVFNMEYFVGGETIPCYPEQSTVNMSDAAAGLLVQQRNERQQNNYPLNPPMQRGIQRQRGGGRRFFPRRQFNNRNAARQAQPQVQQNQQPVQQPQQGSGR